MKTVNFFAGDKSELKEYSDNVPDEKIEEDFNRWLLRNSGWMDVTNLLKVYDGVQE